MSGATIVTDTSWSCLTRIPENTSSVPVIPDSVEVTWGVTIGPGSLAWAFSGAVNDTSTRALLLGPMMTDSDDSNSMVHPNTPVESNENV